MSGREHESTLIITFDSKSVDFTVIVRLLLSLLLISQRREMKILSRDEACGLLMLQLHKPLSSSFDVTPFNGLSSFENNEIFSL